MTTRHDTLSGNGTLRGALRMPLKTLSKPLKSYKNLWKSLKSSKPLCKTSKNLWNYPSQRSSQRPLTKSDFPIETSPAYRLYLCCPLVFLRIRYPVPAKTKNLDHVQVLLARQHCHVIISGVVHNPENHPGLSKYPHPLVISVHDNRYQIQPGTLRENRQPHYMYRGVTVGHIWLGHDNYSLYRTLRILLIESRQTPL